MRKEWSEEDIVTLKSMWTEKYPSRLIADALRKSRNSIIGKARRLGLEFRKTIKSQTHAQRVQKLTAMTKPKPTETPAEPQKSSGEGVSILEVGYGQCRAIIGSSNDPNGLAVMCGEQTYRETQWCEDHFNRYTTRRS